MEKFNAPRRSVIKVLAGAMTLGLGASGPTSAVAQAQPRSLRMAQLLDISPDQQELSRDYSTGVRLAAAEAASGGGRTLQLTSIEVDGSRDSLLRAVRQVKDDPSLVAMLGTVGEPLALSSVSAAKSAGLEIAHIAPWLADTRFDGSGQVFTLFASRDMQIQKALLSLASVGITELGLIYSSPDQKETIHAGVAEATERLKLRTRFHVPARGQDMESLGSELPATSPAVLLFLGGTVELALFSQGMSKQKLQRYLICLSDVNVTTLMQLNPGRSVPLILTNVVPNPQSSSLPVVRAYRRVLKEYFDEAPSPVSLAGYIAGRFALQALAGLEPGAGRAAVLAEMQRRPTVDLGGVRIDFARDSRGSGFVNQTMLQKDGKLIG